MRHDDRMMDRKFDRRTVLGAGATGAALVSSPRAFAASGPPPEPPAAMRILIGEYGDATGMLSIYERGGTLHANGRGFGEAALTSTDPRTYSAGGRTIRFGSPRGGEMPSLLLDGLVLPRRDIDAEVRKRIHATVNADSAALRARALAATPPVNPPGLRTSELVPLAAPGMIHRITYAGSDNFMGMQIYDRPGAFLQRPAAEALTRAMETLRQRNLGVVIYDAYRPWYATWMFWEATPADLHEFVANPANGSRHNRGCAVDLGLTDLATGRIIPMPSRYDEFSYRAYPGFVGGTSRERWYRDTLRAAMEGEGFAVYSQEWWHFDYRDWREYPIGTATFDEVERQP